MTNDVTNTRTSALGALQALKANLQNVRARLPEGGGTQYMRLLKDGEWVFGQEDNAIAPGDEAIINPMSIKQGYSCWTNRAQGEGNHELLGELMVSLNQSLAQPHELPQHTDPKNGSIVPWKDQLSFDLKMITGKYAGTQLQFKTGSRGGLNAIGAIMDAISARLDENTEFICPIISIQSDSYKHKSYGKTYVPKLEIVGWADINGNEEGGDAPKAIAHQPEPEPEPEQEADDGSTRRRRRA